MTARTLYLDIETAPITAHVWGLRDQNVALNQIRSQPRMIGFGAMWEGDRSPKFYSEYHNTSDEMHERAHELLDAADIVVHFNGNGFDIPWLNTGFLERGILPPAPFKNIDLYRVVRKHFRLPSYKLQYISKFVGLDGKVSHTGHQLWIDCLEGTEDEKRRAWALMSRYCKKDVALLPELRDKLLPWITNYPNLAMYTDGKAETCPNCDSSNLQSRGWAITTTRRYRRYQCQACGAWTKDTKSDRDTVAVQSGVIR